MAEDDEIDILGDFNLDPFLTKGESGIYGNSSLVSQNSDLLNCDYTIHPQWLLDRPSANPDNWYNSGYSHGETQENADNIGQISTENCITDESGWTEKEKSLLDRGLEIFGRSNVRLSQFIGSKTASEVKYYLKNFYNEVKASSTDMTNGVGELLHDTQIPASIEEVIAAVSTAKPTIKGKKTDDKSNTKRKTSKFKIKTKVKYPNKFSNIKQKTVKVIKENKSQISKVEITTGKGLSVPICEGEEIIKIKKDDEDVDVDIEDSDEEKLVIDKDIVGKKEQKYKANVDMDQNLIEQLGSLEIPKNEVVIKEHQISELEKIIHSDFFNNRPTKTPDRYLKIRNYIINTWMEQKPQYVTKTSLRQGLKNCGDVNCISKIHLYLEQIGAINFGCQQTNYIRPLYDIFQNAVKEKDGDLRMNVNSKEVAPRLRMKRKFASDGEGGCTLTHDEKGQVINTTIVNEEPAKPKYVKKTMTHLIYCRPFSKNLKKYEVEMNLETLLLMDFHAHTSVAEVMGLIGGTWSPKRKTLIINHYEPCRNIASSATHCDMCPLSQSKAANRIHMKQLDILGWFHSHPTFAPEPSQQDIDTQQVVQLWIGHNTPCIGIILSPFSSNGALISSPYRCMIVDKKENFEDQFVPYKFDVHLKNDNFDIDGFVKEMKRILNMDKNCKEKVNWKRSYFFDRSITFLEKFITSVKMYLVKYGNMNKMKCDLIIENIGKVCNQINSVDDCE